MKRLILPLIIMLLLLGAPRCTAAEDFYGTYTPRQENSSVFYIDIYSSRELTAAVFTVSFPDDRVGYYSVAPHDRTASVRDASDNGRVTVAYAASDAVGDKLCRLSFKALKTGTADFVLHMEQAADADKKRIAGIKDSRLSITLGKDDIVSSNNVTRTDRASSASKTKSSKSDSSSSSVSKRGGGGSDLSVGEEENGTFFPPGATDLRTEKDLLKWVLIGAGIPLMIGCLLWLGILLGRRSADRAKEEKEKPGEAFSEPDDPPAAETEQIDNE